ncbi:MAG TPA: adenylyl-sulfate kinase [Cyanobacteria bacterium UBA11149]|nr:adenylyl-sulfate kinase [Cyanobacteria bacterium UBA11367]HBE58749.1 adenylyl-sulfate kinase [Cyanobacteria bacterium UBA11366]HBK65725.1 adenylyl-sulfate kinase [Cyanobacteria bacterium UBA11166]HBR75091.1 adenylyl-sulfate kinase [Cyanobacteria bacterium UBA11159]HBS71289.1 adenylyl-sulfate kinase [Cyanobacteria bacterium UBA11153]HBW87705.1 adenylyl-sulfate kinase [Cyanobacteria bacterium UBA11149]HCA96955.1 adenylyl-sulfate kinase [Cyanobacteria bacterium UBA9226]
MSETNLPPLIQQMMEPEFYPHSVTKPIQFIQTHISYVLLTGDFAYKLKKPVNFGFLDFSTLALRQHFCHEEIRLNQPNAPEIYLEVLGITQEGHRFLLGGSSEPVEYTVKMRQFTQSSLLSTMFEEGRLTEREMERLGKVVANFHRQCQTSDYIKNFGEVDKIREFVNDNYQHTIKYIGRVQTQEQYEETRAFSDRTFAEEAELFAQRRDLGYIRECHGDLHLRNICLWHDKIQLFDCIEFNEPFRFVDVMYDVAFTVMDLEARGRKDLGNVFLNTYLEETGDWDGLQILRFYLCRQAYVRAKVTSFLLDDPSVGVAEKEIAKTTAANYYKLAQTYTKIEPAKIILMSGLSGAGKSTVARKLARQLGAIHLRSDAVRKHLAGIPLEAKGEDTLYTAEMTQKTYNRLLELGILLANRGFTVILDAKYDKQALRKPAIAQTQKHQIPLEILYCTAPIEVLRDRLLSRIGDVSDATADLLPSQAAAAEPFTEEEQSFVTILDTTQN